VPSHPPAGGGGDADDSDRGNGSNDRPTALTVEWRRKALATAPLLNAGGGGWGQHTNDIAAPSTAPPAPVAGAPTRPPTQPDERSPVRGRDRVADERHRVSRPSAVSGRAHRALEARRHDGRRRLTAMAAHLPC